MKHHILGTGNKLLAEASSFGQVWGMGLRADDLDAHDPHLWRGKNLLGQALSTAGDLLRHNMDGLAHPSSSPQFCTLILSEGNDEINPAPLTRLWRSARACPDPPSDFFTHSFGAPADHSPDVLAVASCAAPNPEDTPSLPEHGPGLVGGTITLDDASFTTKKTVHSGTTASTVFGCVALLDTGPPRLSSAVTFWSRCFRVARPPLFTSRALPLVPGGIRQIRSPTNFDERPLERPILPG